MGARSSSAATYPDKARRATAGLPTPLLPWLATQGVWAL
jgi:hypothetical protein